jgi:hypothetical protein
VGTRLGVIVAAAVLLGACTDAEQQASPQPSGGSAGVTTAAPPPTGSPAPPQEPAQPVPELADPGDVRAGTALRAVRHLAGDIGPRPGTTRAYFRAAAWVEERLTELGWEVRGQSFRVPAGFSVAGPTEGLPVEGGRSVNLVATRGDVVPGEPWLAVGAHLDTVPTSPGAEDNGSGVGVLLAVAEALTGRRTRLPVVLIAFGAEEPRGEGDAHHHYGSRAYVASLSGAERRSLRGMVSLDRVGVRGVVPVGSAVDPDREPDALHAELLRAARRADVPAATDPLQRSSDHWSFVRAGLPGVRLGSTPYAAYHSADDEIGVVDPRQLGRVARVVVSWLR